MFSDINSRFERYHKWTDGGIPKVLSTFWQIKKQKARAERIPCLPHLPRLQHTGRQTGNNKRFGRSVHWIQTLQLRLFSIVMKMLWFIWACSRPCQLELAQNHAGCRLLRTLPVVAYSGPCRLELALDCASLGIMEKIKLIVESLPRLFTSLWHATSFPTQFPTQFDFFFHRVRRISRGSCP